MGIDPANVAGAREAHKAIGQAIQGRQGGHVLEALSLCAAEVIVGTVPKEQQTEYLRRFFRQMRWHARKIDELMSQLLADPPRRKEGAGS